MNNAVWNSVASVPYRVIERSVVSLGLQNAAGTYNGGQVFGVCCLGPGWASGINLAGLE